MTTIDSFSYRMEHTILPWIESSVSSGYTITSDGTHLRYYYAHHPEEIGSITIVHGLCEFFGKYHEVFYRFYHAGYSVYFLELRGHGLSDRKVVPLDYVDIESYDQYLDDVKSFTNHIVFPTSRNTTHILFGHSMGGCIATLYADQYPEDYDIYLLSSPMFGIHFGDMPKWKIKMIPLLSKFSKKHRKQLLSGAQGWTGEYAFKQSNCTSKERYEYQYQQRLDNVSYQTWNATVDWYAASLQAIKKAQQCALRITKPILLLQAGHDTMVDNKAQDQFEQASDNTTILCFPYAKHEIFNSDDETVDRYYEMIFRYLNKNTPQ